MSIIVSDTSPIRAFAHLGRFDLLAALFGEVLIPPAVVAELEMPKSKLPRLAITGVNPFRVRAPADIESVSRFRQSLDPGESEAMALAIELQTALLIDESAGRAAAAAAGIHTIGTLGALLLAKKNKLIPSVRPLMERLRDETTFYISPAFFKEMIRLANESQ